MTELRPFQIEGAKQIYRFGGRALLADEMGLGKTLQALFWILKTKRHRPVVIVCPAGLKYSWQSEAALHFDLRTEVLDGKRPRRMMQLPGPIVIVGYEMLDSWLPALLRSEPQCVIVDEIHYCKNEQAGRTKAVTRLVQDVPSVIGISGTPLTNRPIELWAILQIIRPDIFPSRGLYAWRYCKPTHTPWGWKYKGATRLPELHKILRRECMIRRTKAEVLPELPAKVHKILPFRLRSYAEYNDAQDHFLRWLRKVSPARALRAKKSQALVKIGYLLRLVAKLKLEWTANWIAEFLESHPDQKLIAFTMHTFVIDYLRKKFPDSVVIDGRVTGRKRQETVRKFQNNRRIRLFFGNWRAAGVGITLTSANVVAALDFPWTPGDLLQGIDRAHRIGQKHKVMIYYPTVIDTIEHKQIKLLHSKSDVLNRVLDGGAGVDELDVFNSLLKFIWQENRKSQ